MCSIYISPKPHSNRSYQTYERYVFFYLCSKRTAHQNQYKNKNDQWPSNFWMGLNVYFFPLFVGILLSAHIHTFLSNNVLMIRILVWILIFNVEKKEQKKIRT